MGGPWPWVFSFVVFAALNCNETSSQDGQPVLTDAVLQRVNFETRKLINASSPPLHRPPTSFQTPLSASVSPLHSVRYGRW